jgi:cell division protein ZapA
LSVAKAEIRLRGRLFSIACAAGQEGRIERLGEQLDTRVQEIAEAVGNIGEERLLLIAALALLDELDAALRRPAADSDASQRAARLLEMTAEKVEALAARLEARP